MGSMYIETPYITDFPKTEIILIYRKIRPGLPCGWDSKVSATNSIKDDTVSSVNFIINFQHKLPFLIWKWQLISTKKMLEVFQEPK